MCCVVRLLPAMSSVQQHIIVAYNYSEFETAQTVVCGSDSDLAGLGSCVTLIDIELNADP